MRVLVVEDDSELRSVLQAGLREKGWHVETATGFRDGALRALHEEFDVIVLDVMLPDGSGFELCRTLRAQAVASRVLMLTARDAVDDRVTGLEVGADDYLVKPFAFRELLARLAALARRPASLLHEVVRVADLEVNLATHSVRRGDVDISLTAKEFALLELFLRHAGRVVDRASITAHVWDENHDPFTNVLEVLVRRLRRKIDDAFEPKLIHTLRGSGYRFGA